MARKGRTAEVKLRPLGAHILVEPVEQDETTPGGVILPETAKEKPQQGRVLAVGPGELLEDGKRAPMDVKVDELVIYSRYSGTEFKMDGHKWLILDQKDVLAVVEK